jgi:hypothetical protein
VGPVTAWPLSLGLGVAVGDDDAGGDVDGALDGCVLDGGAVGTEVTGGTGVADVTTHFAEVDDDASQDGLAVGDGLADARAVALVTEPTGESTGSGFR